MYLTGMAACGQTFGIPLIYSSDNSSILLQNMHMHVRAHFTPFSGQKNKNNHSCMLHRACMRGDSNLAGWEKMRITKHFRRRRKEEEEGGTRTDRGHAMAARFGKTGLGIVAWPGIHHSSTPLSPWHACMALLCMPACLCYLAVYACA